MKFTNIAVWIFCSFIFLLAHAMAADEIGVNQDKALTLVRDGKPNATIVISQAPTRVSQLAAYEFQHHIELITGAKLPINADNSSRAAGVKIYIGDSAELKQLGIDTKKFKNQEYIIRFLSDAIILAGRDKDDKGAVKYSMHDPSEISGLPGFWDEQGTLYAVYDFLERYCHVRWFNPTEYGISYPNAKTLVVKKGNDIRRSPAFSYRDVLGAIGDNVGEYDAYVSLWRDETDGDDFKAWDQAAYPELHKKYPQNNLYQTARANLARLFLLRMRNGGKIARCNHTMDGYLYRYWDKDNPLFVERRPEYFAKTLIANQRPMQVCFTNPGLIQQVTQDACDYYDGKKTGRDLGIFWNPRLPNLFPVEPSDNNFFCKCSNCQSLIKSKNVVGVKNPVEIFSTGVHSNYYFHFINEIAKKLNKSRPGKEILTLAYMSHAKKPSFDLEPNVAIQFCFPTNRQPHGRLQYNNELKLLKEWATDDSKRPLYLWLYYTFPLEFSWGGNYHCFPGFFAHTIDKQMKLFAKYGIRGMFHCGYGQEVEAYVTFKLMDDPTLDIDVLLDDYFSHMYGKAAEPMKELYLDIEKTYCNPKFWPKGKFRGVEVNWRYLGTKKRMDKYEGLLAEAEKLADTDADRKRIDLFKKAVWNYMTYGRQNYLNPNKFPIPKIPEIVIPGEKTISDTFSKPPLNAMWQFTRENKPVQSQDFGGTLVFLQEKDIKVSISLPDYKPGTACEISFDLCHSATANSCPVTIRLCEGSKAYNIQMSDNTKMWGNGPVSGVYIYEANEKNRAIYQRLGPVGSGLFQLNNKWDKISLKFDPSIGLIFKQTKPNGDITNFLTKNMIGISKIDKIEIDVPSNLPMWHFDNFNIRYTSIK